MSRSRNLATVVMTGCLLALPLKTVAQSPEAPQVDVGAITAQWPNLSAADFVKEIVDSRAERFQWEAEALEEYRVATYAEAARRLQSGQAVPLEHLVTLAEWTSYALELPQQHALGAQLLQQLQANSSVDAVQAVYRAHRKLHAPIETRTTIVTQWMQGKDLSQLPEEQQSWFEQVNEIASANWADKSSADFVKEITDSREARSAWQWELLRDYRLSVYEESSRRIQMGLSPEDTGSLETLAKWAAEVLTPEEMQQVREALISGVRGNGNASFEEMQAAYGAQRALGGSHDDRLVMVKEWLTAREMSQVTTDQLRWCVMAIRPHRNHAKAGFSVTWAGRITPPHNGEYVFSICPLGISTEFGKSVHHQWMTVEVNGQRVVDATPEAWNWQGNPITLTGGQSVPIQVTFRYEKNATWRLAPAILFWQGPGFARSLVPPSVLKQPEGEAAGLAAEYRWDEPEGEQVRTLVDPNVDFAWTEAGLASPHLDLMRTTVSELFDRVTAAEFLAQYGSDGLSTVDGELHPLFRAGANQYFRALTYATTAQRRQWIGRLLTRPEVFAGSGTYEAAQLYKWFRAGCEREALDLLGTWMQQNPNIEPVLASSHSRFYRANRLWFRDFTIGTVWEHPPSIGWLQEEYLEDEQGNCILPAAYTLGIAYLVQGKIEAWIALLHEKLDDPTVTGDRRVNWLLALAQAEEIRRCPPERHYRGRERLDAGMDWLAEAVLIAETPATKLRVQKERAARLTALRRWDAAEAELQGHPQSTIDLIAQLQEQVVEQEAQQRAREIAARRTSLAARAASAAARGDSQRAQQFQEALNELDPPSE